jgi:tRNA nucleotidyltransferase (CCA-adding enzyme)
MDLPIFDAIPSDVVGICRCLREHGKRGWVVGGCVRDVLRGATAKDWDVATDARPEEVQRIFRRTVPTGIDHGTITVLIAHQPYEVTTLRGEGVYQDGRRPSEVVFHDDIVEDLARRDFTFNAIAVDPLDRVVVDPFDGRGDLERNLLRAVGDAHARFCEDGLRILRAARFAAVLECHIDPATRAAMAAEEPLATLRKVSVERVHDEWLKTMRAARPSVGFSIMQEIGVLAIFAPELTALWGLERPGMARDLWAHSLAVVDALAGDPVLRLAGLFHDVGVPRDPDSHAAAGAAITDEVLRRLKFSNEHRERVVGIVRHHRIDPHLREASLRRWLREVGRERVAEVIAVAEANLRELSDPRAAEIEAFRGRVEAAIAAQVPLSTRELAIKGGDLIRELGLAPGPRLGEILDELVEVVIDEPARNERGALLAEARRIAAANES